MISGSAAAATINVQPGTNTIQKAISKSHSGDTIKLSTGTYYEHDLVINKKLAITGPKTTGTPTAIIDAQQKGRVLNITSGVTVTLKYLTIKNGKAFAGGGIYNIGNLFVTDCYVKYNTANQGFGGGIYNSGSCNVIYSNISNNIGDNGGSGGGICNDGNLNVTESIISENKCKLGFNILFSYGGGITNAGVCTISNSIISKNIAHIGGAIFNAKGTVKAHYNQFYSNDFKEIIVWGGSVNAEDNWWGSNSSPKDKIEGKVYFTPRLTDYTSPYISSSNPVNCAVNIPRNKTITLKFNQIIKKSSILWIELRAIGRGTTVPITTIINGNMLTIKPAALLEGNTTYTLALRTSSKKVKTLTFTTGNS